MITEKSCGAIVYTRIDNQIKYVIIRSKRGKYGFPKGHMESGENEKQTALREILEETGLSVSLVEGFKESEQYVFSHNGESISKAVTYFLAKYFDQVPVAQKSELSGVYLMGYENALSCLKFESAKNILRKAQEFLTK